MSNLENARAVVANVIKVLTKKGLKFKTEVIENPSLIPASQLPAGQLFFEGTLFTESFGEKPDKIEDTYVVKVIVKDIRTADRVKQLQEWVHNIREALKVPLLNIDDLSTTQYVSRVETIGVTIENLEVISTLNYSVSIRYREI